MVILNKRYTEANFKKYIDSVSLFNGCIGVTIHHTGNPTLQMRPDGLTPQHILNIKNFYETKAKGAPWKSGPHFFVDDSKEPIIAFSPVSYRGTHASGFNANYIGIEMLGNYDIEDPNSPRARKIIDQTAFVAARLLRRIGARPSFSDKTLTFHRHSHINPSKKTCPGTRIIESEFLSLVLSKF